MQINGRVRACYVMHVLEWIDERMLGHVQINGRVRACYVMHVLEWIDERMLVCIYLCSTVHLCACIPSTSDARAVRSDRHASWPHNRETSFRLSARHPGILLYFPLVYCLLFWAFFCNAHPPPPFVPVCPTHAPPPVPPPPPPPSDAVALACTCRRLRAAFGRAWAAGAFQPSDDPADRLVGEPPGGRFCMELPPGADVQVGPSDTQLIRQ